VKLEVAIQSTKFKNEMHKAGLNVMYTAWWIKTATNFALKEFDLTQEQYNVMRILNGKHPTKMCVKDIASRMIEKNSNVPRIVDRLELKSLIVRSQGEVDGRQTEISLTQKGIDTLLVSTVALNELWDEKFELSNEEAKTLNDLLEKVRIKEI
jgi:DNA-binding MarR family transcriptional regulator